MACTAQRPHGGRDAVLVHSRALLQQLVEAARLLTEHLAAAATEPVQQAAAQLPARPSLPGLPAAEGCTAGQTRAPAHLRSSLQRRGGCLRRLRRSLKHQRRSSRRLPPAR